ncbi:MAG: C/D box methylation guide ribonucleoprotein complex aNOP56 subunit [Candidatus Bathyarchaeia archaeon]
MSKLSLVESVIGILALDEGNQIVDNQLFPREPQTVSERILKLEAGEIIPEVEELVRRWMPRNVTFILESEQLATKLKGQLGVNTEVQKPSPAGEAVRSNLSTVAVQLGFVDKPEAAQEFIHSLTALLARMKVKEAAAKRDLVVVQMINSIDELDKTANLLASRIAEWYGLHFPEMARIIDSHDSYTRIIMQIGERENIDEETLSKLGLTGHKARSLEAAAKSSSGAPMDPADLDSLRTLCKVYMDMTRLRKNFTEKLDGILHEVAPNVKALAGSTVAARLIALAGGIDRLARMPSSTVQVLGAEKALFRSLKSGAKPPKHGVLFQHQYIHQAPRWQRGKIARALAAKLAIAARVDSFSRRDISSKLKTGLEAKVEEIHQKYRQPLEGKPPTRKAERRGKWQRRA